MASSSSTARFLYAVYDWNNTPTPSCFSDSCFHLPLPPPPPLVYNNSSSKKSSKFLPNFLITAAALLAFLFFLLLLSSSILRRRRPGAHLDDRDDDDDAGVLDDDGAGGTHHAWLIRTVGLEDSVISAIPAVIYKGGDGAVGGGKDCAVCLGEFTDGEVIKLLPKCNHVFHPNCIDTWLKSHVNCPLCRAPIVLESTQLESKHQNQEERAIGIDSTSGSSSSSSNGLRPIRRSVSMDCLSVRQEFELGIPENTKNRRGKTDDVLRKHRVEMKRSLSSKSERLFFSRYRRGHGRSASVLPL